MIIPVATVLTACGIETACQNLEVKDVAKLQQYLPLAVLKLQLAICLRRLVLLKVATVLTACGIETV